MKKELFCKYITEYQFDLYRFAKSIVVNEADSEDAVQESILKAYEKLDTLRMEKKFKAWLFQILANECYAILKRRKKQNLSMTGELPEVEFNDFHYEDDGILNTIKQIKVEYREVILLYYYFQFSTKEIASILKIPKGTVKSRLSRGRNMIKRYLENEKRCSYENG